MKFRPCIDIHNGKVKQIVGASLSDEGDRAEENFVSGHGAAWYARRYREDGLRGGHVILLNQKDSPWYAETARQAGQALSQAPGLLQVGGGVNDENAGSWLEAGASHVIVTSFVFRGGEISWEHLARVEKAAGREHLVLDLSCRKKGKDFYVVTDRWQKWTSLAVTGTLLDELAARCSEFLIHAADVEGRQSGPQAELVALLGSWKGIPMTYAGGIHTLEDIELIRREGGERLDFTVGSALDLFGGPLPYRILARDYC